MLEETGVEGKYIQTGVKATHKGEGFKPFPKEAIILDTIVTRGLSIDLQPLGMPKDGQEHIFLVIQTPLVSCGCGATSMQNIGSVKKRVYVIQPSPIHK